MEIILDTIDTAVFIRLYGRVDSSNAKVFEERMLSQLDTGQRRFITDFSNCDFIDSSGIRVLLLTAKRLIPLGGRIVMVGLNEHIRTVFDIAGLAAVFPLCATEQDALAQFAE